MGFNRWHKGLVLIVCLCTWLVFPAGEAGGRDTAPDPRPDGKIFLYFADTDFARLAGEPRKIDFSEEQNDPEKFYARIIEELIQGPGAGLEATLPGETQLRAVHTGANGVVYVDLSAEAANLHPKGVRSEMLSVFSIVNTLILNSKGIRAVQILIEGSQAQTLAGHVDIRLPLNAQMLLVR